MNATELRNFWQKLTGEKNGTPIALKLYDFWPLTDLTPEEKLM